MAAMGHACQRVRTQLLRLSCADRNVHCSCVAQAARQPCLGSTWGRATCRCFLAACRPVGECPEHPERAICAASRDAVLKPYLLQRPLRVDRPFHVQAGGGAPRARGLLVCGGLLLYGVPAVRGGPPLLWQGGPGWDGWLEQRRLVNSVTAGCRGGLPVDHHCSTGCQPVGSSAPHSAGHCPAALACPRLNFCGPLPCERVGSPHRSAVPFHRPLPWSARSPPPARAEPMRGWRGPVLHLRCSRVHGRLLHPVQLQPVLHGVSGAVGLGAAIPSMVNTQHRALPPTAGKSAPVPTPTTAPTASGTARPAPL